MFGEVSKLENITNIKWSKTMKFKKLNNVKGLLIISSLLEILRTRFFLQIMKTTPYQVLVTDDLPKQIFYYRQLIHQS